MLNALKRDVSHHRVSLGGPTKKFFRLRCSIDFLEKHPVRTLRDTCLLGTGSASAGVACPHKPEAPRSLRPASPFALASGDVLNTTPVSGHCRCLSCGAGARRGVPTSLTLRHCTTAAGELFYDASVSAGPLGWPASAHPKLDLGPESCPITRTLPPRLRGLCIMALVGFSSGRNYRSGRRFTSAFLRLLTELDVLGCTTFATAISASCLAHSWRFLRDRFPLYFRACNPSLTGAGRVGRPMYRSCRFLPICLRLHFFHLPMVGSAFGLLARLPLRL